MDHALALRPHIHNHVLLLPRNIIHKYPANLGEMGLIFLDIIIELVMMAAFNCAFYYFVSEPRIRRLGLGVLEQRLLSAVYVGATVPIAIFLYVEFSSVVMIEVMAY